MRFLLQFVAALPKHRTTSISGRVRRTSVLKVSGPTWTSLVFNPRRSVAKASQSGTAEIFDPSGHNSQPRIVTWCQASQKLKAEQLPRSLCPIVHSMMMIHKRSTNIMSLQSLPNNIALVLTTVLLARLSYLTNPLILNNSKMPEFWSPARDDVANRAGRKRACASRSIGWNWFMIF